MIVLDTCQINWDWDQHWLLIWWSSQSHCESHENPRQTAAAGSAVDDENLDLFHQLAHIHPHPRVVREGQVEVVCHGDGRGGQVWGVAGHGRVVMMILYQVLMRRVTPASWEWRGEYLPQW